jgi:FkbM family methyltransferase
MDHLPQFQALSEAFNRRDMDRVLEMMSDDVDWPNAWKGGRLVGPRAVRDYWTAHWSEIDPRIDDPATIYVPSSADLEAPFSRSQDSRAWRPSTRRMPRVLASLRSRLRARAVTTLASRGIEIHRTRGVRRSLPAVLGHYRQLGFVPSVVFDVGVGPGTPELYEAFPEARLVLVEPLEEWRGHFESAVRARETDTIIAAAGSTPGEVEIFVHRAPWCSSILGGLRGEDSDGTRRPVPVVRLDDIAAERGLAGPYVVKVDVEGAELEVLSGAPDVLRATELVLLEVSLFEFIPGSPQFHDVVSWMHEHGFVVADLFDAHNRLLDGALARMDVAFVQEAGRFRQNHSYGTRDQLEALYAGWGF